MVVMARGELIQVSDLPPELSGEVAPRGDEAAVLDTAVRRMAQALFASAPPEGVYRTMLDRVEASLLAEALERCGQVRLQAAQLLGINRNTLHAKLRPATDRD
jgi:DNA-binding NtrC family response regulator